MKPNCLKLLSLFLYMQALTVFAAELPPSAIKWPKGAEAVIDKAITIKVEAQKQHVTMRSKEGVYGHKFASCMDELATLVSENEQLLEQLKLAEGQDLKAKIALWAIDRKARPVEYARLEHLHVSPNPVGKAAAERNSAIKLQKLKDAGLLPSAPGDGVPKSKPQPAMPAGRPAVSSDDGVEVNRWIIEYLYFAPPNGGIEMGDSVSRYLLGSALCRIRDDRTLVMLEYDLETQIEAFPNVKPGDSDWAIIGGDVTALLSYGSQRAFSIAASLMHHAAIREHLRKRMSYLSDIHPDDVQNPWRGKIDEYKNFADMEWKTDAEKELASWIKEIPPLTAPAGR